MIIHVIQVVPDELDVKGKLLPSLLIKTLHT